MKKKLQWKAHFSHHILLFICNCLIFQILLFTCWKMICLIWNNHLSSWQRKIASRKKHLVFPSLREKKSFTIRQVYFFYFLFPHTETKNNAANGNHWQQVPAALNHCNYIKCTPTYSDAILVLIDKLKHSPHRETWISHDAPVRSWGQSTWRWSWVQKDRRAVLWR